MQEPETEQFWERDLVISASQESAGTEEPETRTVLVGEQNVYWTASDKILVFSAGQSAQFTSRNSSSAATADFVGSIPIPTSSASDPYIRALYPYDSNASLTGGSITTTLPSSQTGVAGTFADDLIILASRATVSDPGSGATVTVPMVFDHLCTGIRFSLTRDDITKVVLSATGGEAIAGKFSFAWNDSGVPVFSSVINPSSTITLNAPSGGTFTAGAWYYIVTLPVASFTQGVKFTLTTSGGQTGVRTIATPFALARGAFGSSANLDNAQYVTFSEGGGDEPEPDVEVQVAGPDTWVATDELGRTLPTDVREKRSDRKVLMFYSDWHTDHLVLYSPIVNVTGVQWFYSQAIGNPTHAAWGDSSNYTSDGSDNKKSPQLCFWGEPLFGYYRTTDPWVLRKHAEMLADAGVDAVFFDCTNGELLWLSSLEALFKTWSQAKADGVNVPKVGFVLQLSIQPVTEREALHMLYYGTTTERASVYDRSSSLLGFYSRGEYSDLWFRLDGDTKPLIMAYPESLDLNDSRDRTIYNFFTWRPGQPDYVYGDTPDAYGNHQWGWLQDYPQKSFNNGEQMTVGVAQNASDASGGHCFAFNSPGSYGRSYTKANGNSKLVEPSEAGEVTSFKYGYNFQEQWDYAIENDPHYVFVTQWNEWVAYKMNQWPSVDASQGWYGSPAWPYYAFPDQYDAERSRDIEPTINWGDNGDNYYYQLAQNVRRFKGIDHNYPNVSKRITVPIDGAFDEWESVSPDFKHYGGNTMQRNHLGHSNTGLTYTNTTGRNDFVDARVARDADYVYFYVETKKAITSRTDAKWMRLLINIDRKASTGWKGYDYCLNYVNPSSQSQGYVSVASGENGAWGWSTPDLPNFDYAVSGNKMEIRVPRSVLGLTATDKLDFEFKWADNNLYDEVPAGRETRILNLYVDGDAAPGGRFNFLYKEP